MDTIKLPLNGVFDDFDRYSIESTDDDHRIGHGYIVGRRLKKRPVSFLFCSNEETQQHIYDNLAGIQNSNFLHTFGCVQGPPIVQNCDGGMSYWVVVEPFKYTLRSYKEKKVEEGDDISVWTYGVPHSTMQAIVRGVINGMTFLHNKQMCYSQWSNCLQESEIVITEGDSITVKFAFVDADNRIKYSASEQNKEITATKNLLRGLLREQNAEQKHFFSSHFEKKLANHPILMDHRRRFTLPDRVKVDVQIYGPRLLSKQNFSNTYPWDQNIPATGVFRDCFDFQSQKIQGRVPYNVHSHSDRFRYCRNACAHYCKARDKAKFVYDLNVICPRYLCDIYDCFDARYL